MRNFGISITDAHKLRLRLTSLLNQLIHDAASHGLLSSLLSNLSGLFGPGRGNTRVAL